MPEMPSQSPAGEPEMLDLAGALGIAGACPSPEAGSVVWSVTRYSQNRLTRGSRVQLWLKPRV